MSARDSVRKRPNWARLHDQLKSLFQSHGLPRKAAVLDNHQDRKEAICRKMGVVCEADILRLEAGLKKKIRGPIA